MESDPGTEGDKVHKKADELPIDIGTSLAFRSIGYKSEPLTGTTETGVPFDWEKGIVSNHGGRVSRFIKNGDAIPIPGLYTSGWVKRGPTGVIASTMIDAFDTGENIASDWKDGMVKFLSGRGHDRKVVRGWGAVQSEHKARGMKAVSWEEWKKIDEAERERGKVNGKEREKFSSEEEMLAVI